MSTKLPVVSGELIIKIVSKNGYFVHHQRGVHVTQKKDGPPATRVVVPLHDPVRKGILKSILFDAGLTTEKFVQLLNNRDIWAVASLQTVSTMRQKPESLPTILLPIELKLSSCGNDISLCTSLNIGHYLSKN